MIDSKALFQIIMKQKKNNHHEYFTLSNESGGIISFLASNQNKFDPNFIASVSTNDVYDLLCHQEQCPFRFRYCQKNEPSSLHIELEKEAVIKKIFFYTPNNCLLYTSVLCNKFSFFIKVAKNAESIRIIKLGCFFKTFKCFRIILCNTFSVFKSIT